MSSPVHTVGVDTSLWEAGGLMLEHGIGSVIVIDDNNRLEGILTATDFIRAVAEGDSDPDTTVAASMSTTITTDCRVGYLEERGSRLLLAAVGTSRMKVCARMYLWLTCRGVLYATCGGCAVCFADNPP